MDLPPTFAWGERVMAQSRRQDKRSAWRNIAIEAARCGLVTQAHGRDVAAGAGRLLADEYRGGKDRGALPFGHLSRVDIYADQFPAASFGY
ncbi:MAG: hypothetical protein EBX37_05375 [Alphaproteobacteria bacterium]|nr:hypothetical protein [Alphaproteobacteria bacterium]